MTAGSSEHVSARTASSKSQFSFRYAKLKSEIAIHRNLSHERVVKMYSHFEVRYFQQRVSKLASEVVVCAFKLLFSATAWQTEETFGMEALAVLPTAWLAVLA